MAEQRFINSKNLGFMQGRLVDSPYGLIQCFPAKSWKKEFKIASENNLQLIEWTVNKLNLLSNPLFSKKRLKEILIEKKKYNIKINSLTCDFFMEKPFFLEKNLKKEKSLFNKLKILLKNSQLIGIKYFILPLVDKSSIKSSFQEDRVITKVKSLIPYLKKDSNILFEIDYHPSKIQSFIKKFNSSKVGINYDSGNSASSGYNFDLEKKYFRLIKNFHIKDRKFKGKTVRLGRGDANIKKILNYMKKKNYKGNFILQTARNKYGKHLKELKINRKFIYDLGI